MKPIFLLINIGLMAAVVSCQKRLEAEAPSLEISVAPARSTIGDTLVYYLGDTTRFLFEGSAYNLALYPGTPGAAYANKDRVAQLGTLSLSFTSASNASTQTGTLALLATNKLPARDSSSIVNAQWTEITDRAALAAGTTAVSSGPVALNDLVSGAADSLFLAFKYTGLTGSLQKTWTITNWAVTNVLPDMTYSLSSLTTDVNYWTIIKQAVPAAAKWTVSASQLQIAGGAASAPDNTCWIVSKALYAGRVPFDKSIIIKNINDPMPQIIYPGQPRPVQGYNYIYPVVGTYAATWLAFNNTIKEQAGTSKTFYIKVIPKPAL